MTSFATRIDGSSKVSAAYTPPKLNVQTHHILFALSAIVFVGGVVAFAVVGNQQGFKAFAGSLGGKLLMAGTGVFTLSLAGGAAWKIHTNNIARIKENNHKAQTESVQQQEVSALSPLKVETVKQLEAPTLEMFKEKLMFVHATDILPSGGVLQAGTVYTKESDPSYKRFADYRQTVHFAMGSLVMPHKGGNWEERRYAIIAPYGALEHKLINLYTHDSFTLGNVPLTPEMTLLVPFNEGGTLPDNVRVIAYNPSLGLRAAIEKELNDRNAWQLQLSPESHAPKASIDEFKGNEVCSPKFFDALLRSNPRLSFGPATTSLMGDAWRIKKLDKLMGDLYKYVLVNENLNTPNYSNRELRLIGIYMSHQLEKIKSIYGADHPSVRILDKEVAKWNKLFQVDAEICYKNSSSKYRLVFSRIPAVRHWLNERWDNLQALEAQTLVSEAQAIIDKAENVRSVDFDQHIYNFKDIADLMACMNEEEFNIVVEKAKLVGTSNFAEMKMFYFLIRWMYFGKEKVVVSLDELVKDSWAKLDYLTIPTSLYFHVEDNFESWAIQFESFFNKQEMRDEVKTRCQEIAKYLRELLLLRL